MELNKLARLNVNRKIIIWMKNSNRLKTLKTRTIGLLMLQLMRISLNKEHLCCFYFFPCFKSFSLQGKTPLLKLNTDQILIKFIHNYSNIHLIYSKL